MKSFSWRFKDKGWQDSLKIKAVGEEGTYVGGINQNDLFFKIFLENHCLGKACYEKCKYKMLHSSADIRIGDLWGKTYSHENLGTSSLLTFTPVGESVVKTVNDIVLRKEGVKIVTEGQMKSSPKETFLRSSMMYLLKEEKLNNFILEKLLLKLYELSHKFLKLILHPKTVMINRLKR